MKIGDLTDRILDEIVSDLTPYGYEELDTSAMDVYPTGMYELDSKKKYVSTMSVSPFSMCCDEVEVVYSHDIMADIILNSNTYESSKLTTEVNERLKSDLMREIAGREIAGDRRAALLKRKTITRAYKKIIRIIAENKVDMSIKEDEVVDISIKEDEIKNFITLL